MKGVICKNDKFAIVDEEVYINKVYKRSGFQVDPNLFDINGPYLMDSQFEAMKNPARRVRKRKRPHSEHLSTESNIISEMLAGIQKAGTSNDFFKPCSSKDNNKKAREASKVVHNNNLSISFSCFEPILDKEGDMWINNTEEFKMIEQKESHFIIPPSGRFFIGDITIIEKSTERFDLIIMDPPWINLSAKRTANYQLSDDILYDININNCLDEKGLICMWITNRKGIQAKCAEFFKSWNIEIIATWYWLKVTKEGEPVCDFHTSHKVPFEAVVIGCHKGITTEWKRKLPETFIFTSIPMAIHSRKPPMQLFLNVFDLKFSRPLELFARNLWPNSTAIGFEPLFMQNSLAFNKI